MSLPVYCFCWYRTGDGKRNQSEFDATKFIKAVKGKTFRGWADIPVPGLGVRRLRPENAADAIAWFGYFVADRIRINGPVYLVPFPDSKCSLGGGRPPDTLPLARAASRRLGKDAPVLDVLRWTRPMPSCHDEGGSRDPDVLYPRLEVLSDWHGREGSVVIIDDVLTSGGHLRAGARVLSDYGFEVEAALCVGRTTQEPVGNAFAPVTVHLEDYFYL